jgi:hypothetical protein
MTVNLQQKINSEIGPLKEKIRPELNVLTKEKYKLKTKLRNNQTRQNKSLQKTKKINKINKYF